MERKVEQKMEEESAKSSKEIFRAKILSKKLVTQVKRLVNNFKRSMILSTF
jgi:hypothetical protein